MAAMGAFAVFCWEVRQLGVARLMCRVGRVAFLVGVLGTSSCSTVTSGPEGAACPCSVGFVCINRLCFADCRSAECPSNSRCVSVGEAEVAVCVPRGESLGIAVDAPNLPRPVDLVWAVENAAHMHAEKTVLAEVFPEFVAALGGTGQVAVRTVVVSSKVAGFQAAPAQDWPPACVDKRVRYCLTDEDCEDELGGPGWRCESLWPSGNVNLNGSINTSCVFGCEGNSECCFEFCFAGVCGLDLSCIEEQCMGAVGAPCSWQCLQPGGGAENSGCIRPPISADCPAEVPSILEGDTLALFRCLAVFEPQQNYWANIEQNLRYLWASLAPDGPNATAAVQFVRRDADLAVVVLAAEEDCSIDPDFASPSFTCNDAAGCASSQTGSSGCETDERYSKISGKQTRLCHGAIQANYFGSCSLLGEYQGVEHHNCAYDLGCNDCKTDADCPAWWHCEVPGNDLPASGGKCRPAIFGMSEISSFQHPPGNPIFSLAPVGPFRDRLLTLKKDPLQVFVAGILGDGLTLPPDKDGTELPSLIGQGCLENEKLVTCQEFAKAREKAAPECVNEPMAQGCEAYRALKLDCVRECYVASFGDPENPVLGGNTYISYTDEFGKAQLSLRLIRFVEMFGPAGAVYNLNAPGGIRAALLDIADRLNKRIYRACLPDGYSPDAKVLLLRHLPGEEARAAGSTSLESASDDVDGAQSAASYPGELLTQGPDADYEILPSWYACCPEGEPDCPTPGPAIQFHAMVKAGTTFEVVYVQ